MQVSLETVRAGRATCDYCWRVMVVTTVVEVPARRMSMCTPCRDAYEALGPAFDLSRPGCNRPLPELVFSRERAVPA